MSTFLNKPGFTSLLIFLLSIVCEIILVETAIFDGCDNSYNLNPGYSYLESPYYPSSYPYGTACRYKFTAPLDYQIQVRCNITSDRSSSACTTEYFYVARDGDIYLRNAEQFCGDGIITRTSLFRTITLAYVSYGSWGAFRCSLYATPQNCDCGWTVSTRIVGGQQTGVNEYPSMVALKDLGSTQPSFCGATIISHRFLLTATHCTKVQPDVTKLLALVGYHNISSISMYSAQYNILQVITHPNYSENPVTNDIALLKTVINIEWSRGVGPICLPPSSAISNMFVLSEVDVIGWGTTSFGGSRSDVLQKITVSILSNQACEAAYEGITTINSSQICTYDSSGSGRDSCQYDSGGPVILRRARMFLLGCVSFGDVCGQGGYAVGVNTRITSYLQWIYDNSEYSTCSVSM